MPTLFQNNTLLPDIVKPEEFQAELDRLVAEDGIIAKFKGQIDEHKQREFARVEKVQVKINEEWDGIREIQKQMGALRLIIQAARSRIANLEARKKHKRKPTQIVEWRIRSRITVIRRGLISRYWEKARTQFDKNWERQYRQGYRSMMRKDIDPYKHKPQMPVEIPATDTHEEKE